MVARKNDVTVEDVFDVPRFIQDLWKYARRHGISSIRQIADAVGLAENTVGNILGRDKPRTGLSLRNAVMMAYWADLKLDSYITHIGVDRHTHKRMVMVQRSENKESTSGVIWIPENELTESEKIEWAYPGEKWLRNDRSRE